MADGVLAKRGSITITINDERDAWWLAGQLPSGDGFTREVEEAIAEAWPEDAEEDYIGLRILVYGKRPFDD